MRRRKRKTPRKPKRAIHLQIKALRLEAKLSQQDLAEKLGLDKSAVSHWENGESAPNTERLPAVAIALGVSIEELFKEAA